MGTVQGLLNEFKWLLCCFSHKISSCRLLLYLSLSKRIVAGGRKQATVGRGSLTVELPKGTQTTRIDKTLCIYIYMYIYWCFAMFLLLDLFVTAYICYFVVVFLHIIKNTYKTTRRFHFSSCSFAFSPRKSDGWFELKPALQLDCLCKKW